MQNRCAMCIRYFSTFPSDSVFNILHCLIIWTSIYYIIVYIVEFYETNKSIFSYLLNTFMWRDFEIYLRCIFRISFLRSVKYIFAKSSQISFAVTHVQRNFAYQRNQNLYVPSICHSIILNFEYLEFSARLIAMS